MEILKDRLIALRKEHNLTQENLANKLNINLSTYKAYETERNVPKLELLKQLADFYEVSLDYLCCRQYNNQIGYIPDDKKNLVKEILDLSESEAKEIYQYIKGYKQAKK